MKLQTATIGSGPPMALVGGGITGWLSWVPHAERLASTRRVTRVQLLSVQYGLEGRPLPADYSVKLESSALAAALDEHPSIDLVAWSFGAAISLIFALDHPDRIRTLTLIEPPAFWVLDAAGWLDDTSKRESDEIRALYASMKGDVSAEQLAAFVTHAGLVPPGRTPQELPQWPSWLEHRRSLLTGDASWVHVDSADRLRAFARPTLLVKGTGSTHFLHRIVDALGATLPAAETIELPGGHAPQLVSLDAFLERLARHHAR